MKYTSFDADFHADLESVNRFPQLAPTHSSKSAKNYQKIIELGFKL